MRLILVAVVTLVIFPSFLPAAKGVTAGTRHYVADTVKGKIFNPDSTPAYGALVMVEVVGKNGSEVAVADTAGYYIVVFPSRNNSYKLTISALGFSKVVLPISRDSATGLVIGNVVLTQAVPLRAVTVIRPRPKPSSLPIPVRPPATPAGIANARNRDLDPRVGIDPAAYKITGLKETENRLAINGMVVDAILPMNPTATFGVLETPVDGSVGGFSGAVVNYRHSASQSFFPEYIANIYYSPGRMGFLERARGNTAVPATDISAGLSFQRILRGKASEGGTLRHRTTVSINTRAFPNMVFPADVEGLSRLGLTPQAVTEFENAVQSLGISSGNIFKRSPNRNMEMALLTRIDGGASNIEEGKKYEIMLGLGDGRSELRKSYLTLPTADIRVHRSTAFISGKVSTSINEIFSYTATGLLNASVTRNNPGSELPSARIRLGDDLLNNGRIVWMDVGGSQLVSGNSRSVNASLANTLSWWDRSGRHFFSVGAGISRRIESSNPAVTYGQFEFSSLEDLIAGIPARFTRDFYVDPKRLNYSEGYVYAGDTWRVKNSFLVNIVLRIDAKGGFKAPAYNPVIDTLFGVRTDRIPAGRLSFSPRLNIQREYGRRAISDYMRPKSNIAFSISRYSSGLRFNDVLLHSAFTGLPNSNRRLDCIGETAPLPDWQNPGSVADIAQCLDGTGAEQLSSSSPEVRVFSSATKPTSRSVIGFSITNNEKLRFQASLQYLRVFNPSYTDLNLNTNRAFELVNEGNRPVYSPAAGIDSASGLSAGIGNRISSQFSSVLISNESSVTEQLLYMISRYQSLPLDASLFFGYVGRIGSMKANGFSMSTEGNPFKSHRFRSSEPTHLYQMELIWNKARVINDLKMTVFSISLNAEVESGVRYTPMVDRDINMDGRPNDIAYIFNPQTTTLPGYREDFNRLLESTSGRARDCLVKQYNSIATINSCRTGWNVRSGLRIVSGIGLKRKERLTVRVDNLFGGLDRMLHGSNSRGWGDQSSVDPFLLSVTGFNPATNEYKYRVNQRFGSKFTSLSNPMRIQVAIQVPIGKTADQRHIDFITARMRERFDEGKHPFDYFDLKTYRNPFVPILNRTADIELSDEQIIAIEEAQSRWQTSVDSLEKSTLARYKAEGRTISNTALYAAYMNGLVIISELADENYGKIHKSVRLTEAQAIKMGLKRRSP